MKCSLCGTRKGKRLCPAVRNGICPVCCGEKRLVELACPEDCSWLAEGVRHDILRDFQDYARRQAPGPVRRFAAALQELMPLLDIVEQAIAETALSVRDLGDDDVIEALDGLVQGYSSEAGGILWQPRAVSPHVERLQSAVRRAMDALRAGLAKEGRGELPAAAIVAALEVERERARFQTGEAGAGASRRFVRFVRRTRPVPSRVRTAVEPAGIVLAE